MVRFYARQKAKESLCRGYLATPICFINRWLSQKRYSSFITPLLFQWPSVHMAQGVVQLLRSFRESSFRLEVNGSYLKVLDAVRNGPIEPMADAAA